MTADVVGTLEPVGVPVNLSAASTEPLKVWGASALTMTVDAESKAFADHPYRVRVGLTNVADVPVYNAGVELLTDGKVNYIYQPRERLFQSTAELVPGDTFWADYVLVPEITGDLNLERSFVKWTGGNTDLPDTITEHPPLQTPDTAPKFEAYGYDDKIGFRWDPVDGASDYQVFATPDRKTDFPATAVAAEFRDERTAVVDDIEPDEARWWAVSPVVDGVPDMRHPIVRASADGEWPRADISQTCRPGAIVVTGEFEDPIFGVGDVVVEGGDVAATIGVDGRTARWTQQFSRVDLPEEGKRLVFRLHDASGAETRVRELTIDPDCLTYAALGDSFSSGEGAMSYLPGTNVNYLPSIEQRRNMCHRSKLAYPILVMHTLNPGFEPAERGEEFLFPACSGALTDDVLTRGQYPSSPSDVMGADPQIDELIEFADSEDVDIVTISIGGNDMGFAGLIGKCVMWRCATPQAQVGTAHAVYDQFWEVYETFARVKDESHGASVFAVGYPGMVNPNSGGCPSLAGFSPTEREFGARIVTYI